MPVRAMALLPEAEKFNLLTRVSFHISSATCSSTGAHRSDPSLSLQVHVSLTLRFAVVPSNWTDASRSSFSLTVQALQLLPDTLHATLAVALLARLKTWKETSLLLATLKLSTNQLGCMKDLDVHPDAEAGGGGPWAETNSTADDRKSN